MTTRPRVLVLLGGEAAMPFAGVARAALATQGSDVTEIDLLKGPLPLFGSAGVSLPKAAEDLSKALAAHQGLVVVAPEINGAVAPAVLNALAWTAVPGKCTLPGLIAALVAPAPHGGTGLKALTQLAGILGGMGALVLPYPVGIPAALLQPGAQAATTVDPGVKTQIETLCAGLLRSLLKMPPRP